MHTPGPWQHRAAGWWQQLLEDGSVVEHEYPDHVVAQWRDAKDRRVTGFVCSCEATTLPNADNARLIAAAPALLEAAKLTVLHFERSLASGNFLGDDEHETWTCLRVAIQKATSAALPANGEAATKA
jgi:hypothetical protein